MKKVAFWAAAALTVSMLGGCANGRSPLDYETGTFVATEKVQELKASKASQQQVVAAIGYPSSKSELSGKESVSYTHLTLPTIYSV